MLVRLLPTQIGSFWNEIRTTVSDSLPSVNETLFANLLENLNKVNVQAWVYADDDTNRLKLIALTIKQGQELVIYAIKVFSQLETADWIEGLNTLKTFARAAGCSKIVGYQHEEEIAKRRVLSKAAVEHLGGRMKVINVMEFDICAVETQVK